MKALTVVQAFGDHQRGSQITDADQIKEILDSEQATKVVAIELPEPEQAASPPPAAE